jgi:hypothetical protein
MAHRAMDIARNNHDHVANKSTVRPAAGARVTQLRPGMDPNSDKQEIISS